MKSGSKSDSESRSGSQSESEFSAESESGSELELDCPVGREQIRQWQDDLQLAEEEFEEAREKEKLAQYQAAGKMKEYELLKQKAERCKQLNKHRGDSRGRQANPSCGYGDGDWLGRNPTGRLRNCQSVTQMNEKNDDRWMMGRYWLAFGL